jgi:flagellar biosynthetic protein FliR
MREALPGGALWALNPALIELARRAPVFLLATLRIALVFANMPAPFGGVAPIRIRTALSLVVTAALLMPMFSQLPEIPLEPLTLLKAAMSEVVIGGLIGLSVRATMAAADAAGAIAGQSMGLGFAGTVDPACGESVVPTAYLLDSLASVIFFGLNCHHVVLRALAESFHAAPVGAAVSDAWRGSALLIGADLIARGLQIAAPVVASMFLVQIGVAFVSRTAPRVHLFAFAFSVSVGAGMLVMWVAAPAVCTAIANQVRHVPDAIAAIGGN